MLGPNSLLSSLSRTGGDRLLASIWMSGPGFLFRPGVLPGLGLCAVFMLPLALAPMEVFLGSFLLLSPLGVWMTAGVTILP